MISGEVRAPEESDRLHASIGSPRTWPPKSARRRVVLVLCGAALLIATATYLLLAPRSERQEATSALEQQTDLGATALWASPGPVQPSSVAIDPEDLRALADNTIPAELARTGAPGAAVTVVQNGQVMLLQGYGLADHERGIAWDAQQTTFIAKSVSKLFTVTAVMQLVEQGQLDLDADVNMYLPTWKIQNPFPEPIRVRDLLTHTTGIEDRALGSMTARPEDVVPLGVYLQSRLLTPIYPPGTRISYSDHNTTVAGYLVELRTGMPFAEYMQQRVLGPIGMTSSSFAQPRPADLASRLAAGYLMRDGQAQRIYPREPPAYNVAPAVALTTTASDVAQFMIAQLENGQTPQGRLLGESALAEMQREQYTSAPGLPGIALGFFERAQNGHRELTHSGGGHGWGHLLMLLPDEHTGVFVAGNLSDDTRVAEAFTTKFMDRYFPSSATPALPSATAVAVDARAFAGTYRSYRYDRFGLDKISHVNEADVQAHADGTLSPSADPGRRYAPITPVLFQQIGGEERIAFAMDGQRQAIRLYAPGGVYDRIAWYEPVGAQALLLLGAVVVLLSVPIASVVAWVSRFFRTPRARPASALTVWARRIGLAVAVTDLVFVAVLGSVLAFASDDFGPLARALNLAYAGSPALFVPVGLAWLSAVLTLATLFFAGWSWRVRVWSGVARVHYTLVTLAAVMFVWILAYWNFLGGRM